MPPSGARANPALAPLAALNPPLPLAVAFSGGADSTALLLAAASAWPGAVQALHVHHGLQPAADGFASQCERICATLGIPLRVMHVKAAHAPGQSPEEAARKARYAALAASARDNGAACVLLAQHADDQVETVLLALSRGAGLPGLAAMPARFERHGVLFLRPLLQLPGALLRGWLKEQGIAFVVDPANSDPRYTRSRIRRLLPTLEAELPGFREAFARSARHAAQAQQVLDEVAAQDLASMEGEPRIEALQALSRPRQANLLRFWLRRSHAASASAAQLDELLDQVADCTTRGHRIALKVGEGIVTREGPGLHFVRG